MVPKASGKWRPIIDLSTLNTYVNIPTFRMDTLDRIKPSLLPDSWAASLDLQDAYLQLPIHTAHRKYLRFSCDGTVYQFQALPFGLSTSPWIFTAVMNEVKKMLHRQGIQVYMYLDDWLVTAESKQLCTEHMSSVRHLCQQLGLVVNEDKSTFTPTQEFVFLGFRLNLRDFMCYPTEDRVEKIRVSCQHILAQQGATAYQWQVLLGLLAATEKAVPLGRLHSRESLFHLRQHWDFDPSTRHRFIQTSPETTEELIWWTHPHNVHRGTTIHPPEPQVRILTDASQDGWGGHCLETEKKISGVWRPYQRHRHINWLELKAIHLVLQHWCNDLANQTILIQSDNSTAVSYLNKQGGGGKVKAPIKTCFPSIDPVRRPKRRHQTATHPRETKRVSGPAIEKRPCHIDRVGTESGGFPTSNRGLGNTTSGFVRDQGKSKASDVRLALSGCRSDSSRRDGNVVDDSVGVRVSAVCSTFSSTSESTAVSSRPCISSTALARGQLVSASVRDVSGRAQATSSTSRPIASGVDLTFQPGPASPTRVSAIRSALTRAGFSEAVASRAAQPQRESTLAVYESKWRSFVSWCHTREVDPIAASAAEVADFLLHLSTEKKLQLSTIEGYRMAIASVLRSSCGTEVGRSDTLRALMKSIALNNIRDQPTVPEWDLLLVLNRLRQAPFEPIRLASIKLLTWKTLFLVTLASGKRRGEIHALSFKKFLHKENWSKVTFSVISSFITKTQILERGAKSLLTFEIKAMASFLGQDFEDDHLLCPVRAVRVYLERTKALRKNQQLFFISPHSSFEKDIKPATISAWLKKTIMFCYDLNKSSSNRNFRAHSIRSKAVSWAFRHQASLEQILAAGTWRSANTFTSFYLKEISSTSASGTKLTPFIAAGRVIDVSL